jgi:hypothetical protein
VLSGHLLPISLSPAKAGAQVIALSLVFVPDLIRPVATMFNIKES